MTTAHDFPDAGDDSDLRRGRLLEQWRRRRSSGRGRLNIARKHLASGNRTEAERAARESLAMLRSALNWAEFGPKEEQAHIELDRAGRWIRSTFGCRLDRDGTEYSLSCPVALAHNRVGLSVGGVATSICSLCGGDASECPHRRGRAYLVPGGSADLGWCRACLSHGNCAHSPDQLYRAAVVTIVTQMELEEVSLVSRPAHPDARLHSRSVSHDELRSRLGWMFVPGLEINCDRCLAACDGLVRPDLEHV